MTAPLDTQSLLIVNVYTRATDGRVECVAETNEDCGAVTAVSWTGRNWLDISTRVERDMIALFHVIRPHLTLAFVYHSGDDDQVRITDDAYEVSQ